MGQFTRLQREVWRAATLASLCGAGLVIIWIELIHRVCLYTMADLRSSLAALAVEPAPGLLVLLTSFIGRFLIRITEMLQPK